jgi:tetratricopeptide (TPR) repeat protein
LEQGLFFQGKLAYHHRTRGLARTDNRNDKEPSAMPPSAKSIREDLARAKAAYAKNDELRAVQLLAVAFRSFVTVKLPSSDRIPIEGLFRECLTNISKLDGVKKYAPNGIPYVKGQEPKLAAYVVTLAKKLEADLAEEGLEAMRQRKLRIDHAIIKGTKFLAEGNLLEAQRSYRAAVEDFVDEKGLFPLIASRLIDAGHHKASLEYLKRSLEESPENPRNYDFLMLVGGKGEEWAAVERLLLDARPKNGTPALYDQTLAVAAARLGHWDLAQAAAGQALAADPKLEDAKRVLAAASQKNDTPKAQQAP